MNPVDQVMEIMQRQGGQRYGGEEVSQLAHALQCANWAQAADASDGLVAAALLHDIGHLIQRPPEEALADSADDLHEARGADYLARWFPEAVTEPIRLHVPAKRYLCATEADYFGRLSEASVQSLALQGGAFDEAEARAFIARPFAEDAVRLRRWDEAAKDPEAPLPELESFRPILSALHGAQLSAP